MQTQIQPTLPMHVMGAPISVYQLLHNSAQAPADNIRQVKRAVRDLLREFVRNWNERTMLCNLAWRTVSAAKGHLYACGNLFRGFRFVIGQQP